MQLAPEDETYDLQDHRSVIAEKRAFPERDLFKKLGRQPKTTSMAEGRILRRHVKDGREHYYHATRGWKSRRI